MRVFHWLTFPQKAFWNVIDTFTWATKTTVGKDRDVIITSYRLGFMMKWSDIGITQPCYDVIRVVKMVALGSNQWSITLFQELSSYSKWRVFCCLPTDSLAFVLHLYERPWHSGSYRCYVKGDIAKSCHFLLDMVKCFKTCNYDVLNRRFHQIAKDKRIIEPRFKRSIPDLWFLYVSINVLKFVVLFYVIHAMNMRHLLFTLYLNIALFQW